MANTPSNLDTHDDAATGSDHASRTGISRWQTVVGSIGLLVVLWVGDITYDTITRSGPPGGAGPGQEGEGEHRPGPPPGGH